MKNTNSEIPSFAGTEVWRWSQHCTDTRILFAYFKYMREHMQWLETVGKIELEQQEPWTRKQFETVKGYIALLVHDVPELIPFKQLLRSVLKKGVDSLVTLAQAGKLSPEEADQYLRAITFFLETGGPCEIDGDKNKCNDSATMIDSLVPVAQAFKDIHMLERIARCRIRGWAKELPTELYVKHFKNW